MARRKFGVTALPLAQQPSYAPALNPPRGIVVTMVQPDGAAAEAGVRPGDVMLTLGTIALMHIADLQSALARTQPGGTLPARLWRNGREIETTLRF